jgi:hypothetical protein
LKGYRSQYWIDLYIESDEPSENHKSQYWGEKFVDAIISLLKHIWDDRNQYLHGM